MSNKKKVERYIYPAIFTYEDGCEIAVEFPDLDTFHKYVPADL